MFLKGIILLLSFLVFLNNVEASVYQEKKHFSYDEFVEIGGLSGKKCNLIVPPNYFYYKDSIIVYTPEPGSKEFAYYALLQVMYTFSEEIYIVRCDTNISYPHPLKKALLAKKSNGGKWETIKWPNWVNIESYNPLEDGLIELRIAADATADATSGRFNYPYLKNYLDVTDINFSMVGNNPCIDFKHAPPETYSFRR